MIPISKKSEPAELIQLRRKVEKTGRPAVYEDLQNPEKVKVLKKLIKEQGGICAYCMCRISAEKNGGATIEHIVPRSRNPKLGLDYKNMVAVCPGNREASDEKDKSCDASRGNKDMLLNPCEKDTLRRIYYSNSGRIYSTDGNEQQDLDDALHLNSARDLVRRRKSALDGMLKVIDKNHSGDKEYYNRVLEDFQSEGTEKPPFVGILIWWLSKRAI